MKQPPPKNKKFTLEYAIRSSPAILFEFISTPSGLAQWFADGVNQNQDVFIFSWEGNKQRAKMVDQLENEMIRFRWEDSPKDEYFEFKISHTEITGDTVLFITDFTSPKEIDDAQKLWDSQIHELKLRIGGL
ncbi:MAG: START-like domain-containing protein [Chitinophagales bacterium]